MAFSSRFRTLDIKEWSLNNDKPLGRIYGRYVECISHLSFEAGIKIYLIKQNKKLWDGDGFLIAIFHVKGGLLSGGQNKFCQPKEVKARCD